jgi:hypothetical protein
MWKLGLRPRNSFNFQHLAVLVSLMSSLSSVYPRLVDSFLLFFSVTFLPDPILHLWNPALLFLSLPLLFYQKKSICHVLLGITLLLMETSGTRFSFVFPKNVAVSSLSLASLSLHVLTRHSRQFYILYIQNYLTSITPLLS